MTSDPPSWRREPSSLSLSPLFRFYSRAGFFNLGTVDIWARSCLAVEECPGHCRMFGDLASVYQISVAFLSLPELVTTKNVFSFFTFCVNLHLPYYLWVFRASAGSRCGHKVEPPSYDSASSTGYQFSKPDIISQLEEEESRVREEDSNAEICQGE